MKIKLLRVVPSNNKSKKWTAIFLVDGKERRISFGASGYRDYTLISNKTSKFYLPKMIDRNVVKASYIRRHEKRENFNDPMTAGSLSRWILWDKPNFNSAVRAFKKRFKL